MERVLIVNPFGIGDVLFSTPLVASIRKAYPASFIGYLCNRRTQPLVSSNPYINTVFVFEKDEYMLLWRDSKIGCIKRFISLLRSIKRCRFEVLIDLSLGDRYSLVLYLLGIRKRLGFNYKNRGRFLTDRVECCGYTDRHIVEYYAMLLKLLNMDLTDNTPRFFLKDEDVKWAEMFLEGQGIRETDLLIAVVPSSGRSWGKDSYLKRWNYCEFAKVCSMLIERHNAKVMLLGDTDDAKICNQVAELIGHSVLNFSGKTTLCEFASLVAKSSLVITNDGGPLHIAVGVGAKTVSIFGPVDERIYGPYPPGPNHIVIKKDLPCRPCYRNFKMPECLRDIECIRTITADEVFQAAKRLLNK